MKKVAIVTDTTACVPPDFISQFGIEIVPVQVIIDGKTFRDGIDITPTEFYSLLRNAKQMPTTASTPPQPYLDAFLRAAEKAHGILCLTEPSRFSAMFASANVARNIALETLKGVTIEVMESTTAAAGLGLVVLAAARAAELDKSLSEVKQISTELMSRVDLYATLDTLQYLVKSGRVPQAAALVNSILNIKPVFTLNHGDAHTVALPRTMEGALDRMMKLMGKSVPPGRKIHVAVMHADAPGNAQVFRDRIAARFDCQEIYITEFTPVMGVHTGPGLVGTAFYAEKTGE